MIINIYYSKDQARQLDEMQRKYQVSRSTIASTVLLYLTKYLVQENKKELLDIIGKEYLYDAKGNKTSIKTQKLTVASTTYENQTKAYTNAIQIYLRKDVKKYITNSEAFYNDLNKKLQTTREPNWDYNHFIRSMKRYERKLAKWKEYI